MRKATWLAAFGICMCIPLVGCGGAVNNQTNRDATSGYAGGATAPKTAEKPGVPSVGTMRRRPGPTTATTPRALANGTTTISGHTVQVDSAAKTLRLHYTGLIGHTRQSATATNNTHASTVLHLTIPTGWKVVIYESHLRSGRVAVVRYADVQGVRPTDFSSPQLRMAARNANPRGAGAMTGGTAADAAGVGGARINDANPAAGADAAVGASKPTTFKAMRPGRYAIIATVYPAGSSAPILDVITVSNTATTPTVGTFSRY